MSDPRSSARGEFGRSDPYRALAALPPGSHACILYESIDQLLAISVPFIRLGLERGERCIYTAPPEALNRLAVSLDSQGVDVAAERRKGSLLLMADRPYLVNDSFDPDAMVGCIVQAIEQSQADGFNGLRAMGDVAWELGPRFDINRLPDYETKLDAALEDRPVVGLCHYHRQEYPPEILQSVVCSHSAVCLNQQVIGLNPYHEPGQIVADAGTSISAAARLDRMTARLRRAVKIGMRRDEALRRHLCEEFSRETRDRLARVFEQMSDAFIALDRDWRVTYANAEALRISGHRPEEFIGRVVWDCCPEGPSSIVAQEFHRALAEQRVIRLEHLATVDNAEKWLDINVYPHAEGLNVFYRDITERKHAEEHQTLLMREVDHRARNALAVVQSIVALTRGDSISDFVAAVEGRIAALARAHTLLAKGKWSGADLAAILGEELAPYRDEAAGRTSLDGPPIRLVADATQPMAMVVHELATNAAKYGALSTPGGRVAVRWQLMADGRLRVDWRERGGPPANRPRRQGFGSKMIAMSIANQLDGEIDFQWSPFGLSCIMTMAAHRIIGTPPLRTSVEMPERPPPQAACFDGKRILLVEDDALLAMEMLGELENLGCLVVGPAADLVSALRFAAAERLDGAVLDVNLRGRESWMVADVLVERQVPHLFTTGYSDIGRQAAMRGARVLVKPFQRDELTAALRLVLIAH